MVLIAIIQDDEPEELSEESSEESSLPKEGPSVESADDSLESPSDELSLLVSSEESSPPNEGASSASLRSSFILYSRSFIISPLKSVIVLVLDVSD